MGGVGPMLGQAHHFRVYAPEKISYAIDRYTHEAQRLYGVMDRRLARSKYLGGPAYGIADIATFPWLRSWKNQGITWADHPHLKGWFDEIAARPAVQRGVEVLASLRKPLLDDRAREMLFGATQYRDLQR
jgi:GST-like protein